MISDWEAGMIKKSTSWIFSGIKPAQNSYKFGTMGFDASPTKILKLIVDSPEKQNASIWELHVCNVYSKYIALFKNKNKESLKIKISQFSSKNA